MNAKALYPYLLFLAGLFAGMYFIGFYLTGHQLEFLPGDLIDGRFNNYVLEHAYRYFTGKESEYWNAPFLFPEENVITYSDNLLGSAPFYCAFRFFGASRENAFQLWYLLLTVLNYAACYLFLNYLFKNHFAAVCGALIFAFSMALNTQSGHAQTYPRFAIPLAMWMLLKYNESLKPRFFFLALLALVYEIYCGIYLGFLLIIPFAVFLLLSVFTQRSSHALHIKNKYWLLKMLLGVVINVLLLMPLLLPYMQRASQMGLYTYDYVSQSIPTFKSYFFSWHGTLLWDFLDSTCIDYPAFWDHELFPGGFALLAFILSSLLVFLGMFNKTIFKRFHIHQPLVLLFITGIATFLIFIRVNDLSLYRFVFAVPGYGSMRALQRIINIELLFFAIALAYFVSRVTQTVSLRSLLITFVLISLIVADNYLNLGYSHNREKKMALARLEPLQKQLRQVAAGTIVSYEPDSLSSSPSDYQMDAMMAAQPFGLKVINGYTGTSPGGYGPYWTLPNAENRNHWLEQKGKSNVHVLVIH